MHDVDDYPQARLTPGLLVYRYDAPLFFANARDFRLRALAAADAQAEGLRWFVLNVEANVEIDITALDAVEELRANSSAAVSVRPRPRQTGPAEPAARIRARRSDRPGPALPHPAQCRDGLPGLGTHSPA
jgi:MFS superfamily sulfate permease-like transporter